MKSTRKSSETDKSRELSSTERAERTPDLTDPEAVLAQYQWLIKNRAVLLYRANKRHGLLFEDVLGECWLLFMKCVQKWTPDKGTIPTYFYGAVEKEGDRVIARAMGYGTPYQLEKMRDLKRDTATNPGSIVARFWPRTQLTPPELLEAAETKDRARTLLATVTPDQQYWVVQWVRGRPRRSLIAELGKSSTTLMVQRHLALSRIAANAMPNDSNLDRPTPPVAPDRPDVL